MSGSACCQGFIDSGTPTGTETEIGKIACYVADHSSHPKTAIVVLTDIFGFRTPNPRLIADGLAETCECQVYVPDLFDGKEVAGSLMTNMEVATGPDSSILSKIGSYLGAASSFVPFMLRNRISVSLDRTKIVIQELRSSGVDTILLVGYCWGGKLGDC